ncbi:MAG: ABC transporter permease, partial [Mycobacterium sp.]
MTGVFPFIVRRLLAAIPVLILVTAGTFWLGRYAPGDPITARTGGKASPETVARLKHQLHLDDPVVVQYVRYMGEVLHGDFGRSFRTNAQVAVEFRRRFPITLEVVVLSFIFTAVMGVLFGAISALRQNSPLDYGVRLFSIFGLSVPNFLLLTCLLIFPARWWGYAPRFGATDFFKDPSG